MSSRGAMSRSRQRGFTMVELMIALLLGLLVVGAASSVFLSNRRVYGATEAVGRIQENQRAAFEILARDLREAGGNPCMRFDAVVTDQFGIRIADPDMSFWNAFARGLVGAEGDGTTPDAISIFSANRLSYRVTEHSRPNNGIKVAQQTDAISNDQAAVICNNDYAVAFITSGVTASGTSISYDGAANCAGNLTRPQASATTCELIETSPAYCFSLGHGVARSAADTTACPGGIGVSPAYVVIPDTVRWTLEANGRGGSSLFRTENGVRSEIAEGVIDLQLAYKLAGNALYLTAKELTADDWARVTAVHVRLAFQAERGALGLGDVTGTGGAALRRDMSDYVVLRNRQDIQ